MSYQKSSSKRVIRECPHTDRKYYAKGMCVNCYHRSGRTKKAWACEHTRKTHYSKGLCKYCYLNAYYKHRTTPNSAAEGSTVTQTQAKTVQGEKETILPPFAIGKTCSGTESNEGAANH